MRILYKAFGEEKTITQWFRDKRCNVTSYNAFKARLDKGMDLEEALKKSTVYLRKIKAFGEEKTLREWTKDKRCIVDYDTIRARIYNKNFKNGEDILTIPHRTELIQSYTKKSFNKVKILKIIDDLRAECECLNFSINGEICGNKFVCRRHEVTNGKIKGCLKCRSLEKYSEDIGKIFHNTALITGITKDKNGKTSAECKCLVKNDKNIICNNEFVGNLSSIKRGTKRSCGCLRKSSCDIHWSWKGCGKIPLAYFNVIKNRCGGKREFSVSIEECWNLFLKQEQKCALSGVELNFGNKRGDSNKNASLDRIDSSKGYISGNIQWVHKDINEMKMDKTDEEFIKWCFLVSKYKNG